jgi:hypothetical protein
MALNCANSVGRRPIASKSATVDREVRLTSAGASNRLNGTLQFFPVGAAAPLVLVFVSPSGVLIPIVAVRSLLFLAILGAVGATAGGAGLLKPTVRVTFWGAFGRYRRSLWEGGLALQMASSEGVEGMGNKLVESAAIALTLIGTNAAFAADVLTATSLLSDGVRAAI